MSSNLSRIPWSGRTLYTRGIFSVYDWLALGLHCRFIWQCPPGHILKFYNQNVSGNHLDIGVGTGYFLDRCRFPIENPRLALIDISPESLAIAQKRLARYHPQVYRRNILESLRIETPGYDSIGLCHVLHCLPGNLGSKGVIFQHLKPLLNPEGVLFGTTFLYQGLKRNPLATCTFWWTNLFGFMSNKQDSLNELDRTLKTYFSESHIETRGCEALFWARK